jgi:hypothetical protein
MIRNAKVLGLALVAVLAMAAVVASSASAAEFTAASYPVTLSGTQSTAHKFTVGGSTVTCTTATFSGSASGPSPTQTMTPVYTGCTAFGFIGATVTGFPHTGGNCDYDFSANGETALTCASGDVTIDAGPCTATVTAPKNTNLKSNTFTNNTPAAGQVTVDTNVTNVHAEITKSEFGCPVAKGTYANSTYTGTTVVKGENGGKAVSIDVA